MNNLSGLLDLKRLTAEKLPGVYAVLSTLTDSPTHDS
jgi:hypothetical protein